MKKLFILFISIIAMSFALHKYYVSILEFNFNDKSHQLELSVKVFNDDWQNALDYRLGMPVLLGSKNEYPKIDSLAGAYLADKIKVEINGKQIELNMLGSEIDGEATWIYMYADSVKSIANMKVKCTLLTELFEEQRNIVQIKNGSGIKSALLTKTGNTKEFNFD